MNEHCLLPEQVESRKGSTSKLQPRKPRSLLTQRPICMRPYRADSVKMTSERPHVMFSISKLQNSRFSGRENSLISIVCSHIIQTKLTRLSSGTIISSDTQLGQLHERALFTDQPLYRVSSGQGKVREIPDLAKVREKSGNFVEGQGKKWILGKVREKSWNLHLVQSK